MEHSWGQAFLLSSLAYLALLPRLNRFAVSSYCLHLRVVEGNFLWNPAVTCVMSIVWCSYRRSDDIWEHLLCHCSGSQHAAEDRQLQFLRPACRALGVPLTLYSMAHHVATFIWALLQHVHHWHCACPALRDSSMDTGPSPWGCLVCG